MQLRETSKVRLFEAKSAFTLAEVMMCVTVAGMIFAGVLAGYSQAKHRAQHSEHALAALGLAQIVGRDASVEQPRKLLSVAFTEVGPVPVAE